MTDRITAPWTTEQVAALNRFQREGRLHPFTCGNEHPGHHGILIASGKGWYCPVTGCDYEQNWAHDFMADAESWPRSFLPPHRPATSSDEADNGPWEQYAAAIRRALGALHLPWTELSVTTATAAVLDALEQHLDIGEEQAWCKTCRRVWEGRSHRCEGDAEAALYEARETNQRLNLRCQQAESKLATFKRAVGEWELSDRGTYIPLRTLTAIAKAVGREFDSARFIPHYQRVEEAEAAIERVRTLGDIWFREGADAATREAGRYVLAALEAQQAGT